MSCGCEQQTYVPPHPEPWKLVSVSLLEMFLRPVQCLIKNKVFDEQLPESELNEMAVYFQSYIAEKLVDPDTQLFYDRWPEIRDKMDYIYKRNICL